MTPQQIVYKSKSWKDFEKQISTHSYKERGTAFEWLCKFYLMIHPIYKINYKKVLHSTEFLKDKVITKRLGLDSIEEGTDLIGVTFDGKYEIIQCKYKDNKFQNLTAKDINSSISVATGKEASKWVDSILMCSNLHGLTANKRLHEQHRLQFRTLLAGDFELLDKNDFQNIKRAIEGEIPVYASKSPRDHQKIAIGAITTHFKNNNRGQLIHACGTGKTLTSYFAFRAMNPKITLFVVPSLQLINQTLVEWCKESLADGSPISPLVVCSDLSNEKISEHDPQLWLQELGIKVSNSIDNLQIFLSSKRKHKVIFSTYQSGKVLAKNFNQLGKAVDLAFFDEAHNTATSKSRLLGHLLLDQNLPIKKRLFMTATPKRLVGKDDRFFSMDDLETYGEVIDEITVKDAIEDLKLLNDYKIVTQLVDNTFVKKLLKENPFVIDHKRLPEEAELKLISSAITLKKTVKHKKIKNIVSFHGRVNRAKAFQKGLNNIYKENFINTYHVNGTQSGTVRQGILADFANNPPSLVTNAQCLSEGVNVPSIDAVMFVDPKQSKVDITQAIGRALRKGKKNKGDSYIIVPIIIDQKNTDAIDEAYQQILMVLRSMSEHDGRIIEYFRLVKEGKKPPINFVEVSSEYLPEEFDLADFTQKLHFKAWDRVSRLGRRPFEQAKEWVKEQGFIGIKEWNIFSKTSKRPIDIPADPYTAYKKEWISWRDFLGNPTEEDDMKQFIIDYKKYAKGKFDPIPPNRYVTNSGYKLGIKLRSILFSYSKNTLPKWKEELIQELINENIWHWEGRDAFMWNKNYSLYKEYLSIGGSIVPKRGAIFKEANLEAWVQNQKLKYKIRIGLSKKRQVKPLSDTQLHSLKKINFLFEDSYENVWIKKYEEFKPIIEDNKGRIPSVNKEAVKWIQSQKRRYKEQTLEKNRIIFLEKIKYWSWNIFEERLESNLQKLELFYKETKDSNPKQNETHKGFKVGRFLTLLRQKYRNNKLDTRLIKRVESLGIKLKPTRKIGSVIYYD